MKLSRFKVYGLSASGMCQCTRWITAKEFVCLSLFKIIYFSVVVSFVVDCGRYSVQQNVLTHSFIDSFSHILSHVILLILIQPLLYMVTKVLGNLPSPTPCSRWSLLIISTMEGNFSEHRLQQSRLLERLVIFSLKLSEVGGVLLFGNS